MRVILFGTGKGAEIVYNSLNLSRTEIVCFLDNNPAKHGGTFMGYKIDAPDNLYNYSYDYIIIASQYTLEIKDQLLTLGVVEDKIVSYFQIYNNHSDKVFNEFLKQNIFDFGKIVRMYYPNVKVVEEKEVVMSQSFPTILFFNHSYGGGTKVYQDAMINKMQDSSNILLVHVLLNHLVFIHWEPDNPISCCFYVNIEELDQDRFNDIMKRTLVDLIYINQLVSFPVHKFIDLIMNSNIRYLFFVHDYFCVCPSFNLINSEGKYCFNEKDPVTCQACIDSDLVTEEAIRINRHSIDIKRWRYDFHRFLRQAYKIVAPSESAKNIVLGYYPDLHIEVQEHEIDSSVFMYSYDPGYTHDQQLKIAFIGNINKAKGSDLVDELVQQIKKNHVPIQVKVIGTTENYKDAYISDDNILEVTGPYDRNELSQLLRKYRVSLVIVPALWPETFNYTTSEAMQSGYPVMTFNIGAPAERVKRTGAGWVVEDCNVGAMYKLLCELERNRDLVVQRSLCL